MVKLAKLFVAVTSVLPAVQACVTIQYQFPKGKGGDAAKAAAVRKEYQYVWGEYAKYAFGNDSLLPLNHSAENDLFGWGATIIDGIDTAVVMGLTDIVKQQLEWIANTNFNKPLSLVDEFDSFIRYIGGLLSAYDLINSPLVPKGTYDPHHVEALLDAAKTISNHLKPMFNTPSGLPLANINFTTNQASNCEPLKPCNVTTVDTAVCGTLILEWYRLSDLTGDNSYRQLAERAEANLISPSQKLIHPNIVGSGLNVDTGKYITIDGGWQAGIDSFYEYLIKTYVYSPGEPVAAQMKNFWVGAVESTIKYLIVHPYEHQELSFITQLDVNGTPEYTMDDYACFAGGNFLLGGRYLNNQEFINYGLELTDSCHALFNQSQAGLNPSGK
jgi:mannosyl-oligosaccharide alpha-1,2-mannosidase